MPSQHLFARQLLLLVAVGLVGCGKSEKQYKDDPALARDMVMTWSLSRRSLLGGHQTPGLWLLGDGVQVLAAEPSTALYTDLAASNAYAGALKAAASVTCPTLLLLGAEDRMLPTSAARPLAEAIAGSATTIVPDAGHYVMVEQPDAVIDAMADFLAG